MLYCNFVAWRGNKVLQSLNKMEKLNRIKTVKAISPIFLLKLINNKSSQKRMTDVENNIFFVIVG